MNNEKQLTKFQQELREAIHEYGNDICIEYWHGCDITPKLESLILRDYDYSEIHQQVQSWVDQINNLKKALELAADDYEYCEDDGGISHLVKRTPEYWLKQADES